VPSEAEPFWGVCRKIAKPPTEPVLLTSAHPTAVEGSGPVVISKVAFGLIVAVTDELLVWDRPWLVVTSGKLIALPSSL
jgi:hypothetical protein